MDIFSHCSWTVCLFYCLPGCLVLFKFGDTKTLKMLSHIAGVRVLGVWWFWGFVGLGCIVLVFWVFWGGVGAALGGRSRRKMALMSSLFDCQSHFWILFVKHYKIWKSPSDSLLYSLLRLNWYNAWVTASTKWIAPITSFTYTITDTQSGIRQ